MLLPVTPDGNAIYFTSTTTGAPRLMRITTSGGKAEQLSQAWFGATDVSPDGTHACGKAWDGVRHNIVFAILDLRSGVLDLRPDPHMFAFYMPDGRLATFDQTAGKWMVRVLSDPGGAATPMTPPSDDELFLGAASRDGRIAFSRGQRISDVVLISAK
jgi:hypothetical protein